MRSFRYLLAAAAALTAVGAGSSSAAPPLGCYGAPTIAPDAYLCITQFTPENAVPGVGVPMVCAGQCYGPVPILPDSSPTNTVIVYTLGGEEGRVGVVSKPVVPVPNGGDCRGDAIAPQETSPYVCAHRYDSPYSDVDYVEIGTCLGTDCNVYRVREDLLVDVVQAVAERVGDICPNRSDPC